ncbi:cytochrome c [Porticoccaceae bacterium]|nr:cytochrome c [Porticoccaceae bacterium]
MIKKNDKRWLFILLMLGAPLLCNADQNGAELYQRCAGCHLKTAQGVPAMFPPLTERMGPLAGKTAGRDYLVMAVNTGLIGNLEINGSSYRNNMMPGQLLENADTAAVLNYLLEEFNAKTLPKNWKQFTEAEVALIKKRYPNANAQKVYELRKPAFK